MMNQDAISSMRWRDVARRNPSAFLLAAQFLSLIFYTVLEGVPGGQPLLSIFGMLILLLIVWVVVRSPAISWIAWLLATPAILLSVLAWLLENPALLIWAALFEATLYFYGAAGLIIYMMGDEHVTLDDLFSAGATFTLFAWGFAFLYLVCQAWSAGAFSGGPHSPLTFFELLFFSFTNLSATGMSDIVPISSPARLLVMIEQFSGIAYLAVVVSRLIGLTLARQQK
ncbi:MAG TPA: potassium channel family protein [Smithellaceae bacterium]|jgi:hypothetical protein|nr:potassium channel family protein [Smithellaceae bacterium]HQM45231.1 potassium channel family protein [Smithellaceae bacterium]